MEVKILMKGIDMARWTKGLGGLGLACAMVATALMAPVASGQVREGGMNPVASANRAGFTQERELRVYDLRLLVDHLQGTASRDASDEMRSHRAAETVARLAMLTGMQAQALSDGVFAVAGDAGAHAQFEKTLASLRADDAGRYQVSLRVVEIPEDDGRYTVGAGLPTDTNLRALYSTSHAIRPKSSASFEVVVRESYIAKWQPVVSDQSVGYEAEIETALTGFMGRVSIGSIGGDGGRLHLSGVLMDSTVNTMKETLLGDRGLTIGLPSVTTRSFSSETRVPVGRPTIVSLIDGLAGSGRLAVIATLRE